MSQDKFQQAISAFEREEYEEALAAFTVLAKQKNATAQYYLGRMYTEGLGTEACPGETGRA